MRSDKNLSGQNKLGGLRPVNRTILTRNPICHWTNSVVMHGTTAQPSVDLCGIHKTKKCFKDFSRFKIAALLQPMELNLQTMPIVISDHLCGHHIMEKFSSLFLLWLQFLLFFVRCCCNYCWCWTVVVMVATTWLLLIMLVLFIAVFVVSLFFIFFCLFVILASTEAHTHIHTHTHTHQHTNIYIHTYTCSYWNYCCYCDIQICLNSDNLFSLNIFIIIGFLQCCSQVCPPPNILFFFTVYWLLSFVNRFLSLFGFI